MAGRGARFVTVGSQGETDFSPAVSRVFIGRLRGLLDTVRDRFDDWGKAVEEDARAPDAALSVRLRFVIALEASGASPALVISSRSELEAYVRRQGPRRSVRPPPPASTVHPKPPRDWSEMRRRLAANCSACTLSG